MIDRILPIRLRQGICWTPTVRSRGRWRSNNVAMHCCGTIWPLLRSQLTPVSAAMQARQRAAFWWISFHSEENFENKHSKTLLSLNLWINKDTKTGSCKRKRHTVWASVLYNKSIKWLCLELARDLEKLWLCLELVNLSAACSAVTMRRAFRGPGQPRIGPSFRPLAWTCAQNCSSNYATSLTSVNTNNVVTIR